MMLLSEAAPLLPISILPLPATLYLDRTRDSCARCSRMHCFVSRIMQVLTMEKENALPWKPREDTTCWKSFKMSPRLLMLLAMLIAILLGTSYAALLGIVTYPLRASLISWPIWVILFWFVIWKFKLLRFTGLFAVLPLSILTFEMIRTSNQPAIYAFRYLSLDRSHYRPDILIHRQAGHEKSGPTADTTQTVYIAKDGFRGDPETRQGNPPTCGNVLIGDSMIYGSGLRYADTLRPVLKTLSLDACVFGVTGNSPVDYLATLRYVQGRIGDDAHIAIYVYVYNDFISVNKYLGRTVRGSSPVFGKFTNVINYYDDWRRTTFIQGALRKLTAKTKEATFRWHLDAISADIEVSRAHSVSGMISLPQLIPEERATFRLFLQQLRELVANRHWRVSIVFIPDNEELAANIWGRAAAYQDLDPRRA